VQGKQSPEDGDRLGHFLLDRLAWTEWTGASGWAAVVPFLQDATVVEQTSRTLNNPDKQFYTCKNRDWVSYLQFMLFNFVISKSKSRVHRVHMHEQDHSKCSFFMWKPVSDGVDAATVMARLQALENSLLVMSNDVRAQSVDVRSIARQQRLNRWMNVASVFVGVVSFVLLCMLMYNQG
jgi:hypothetical protein